MTNAQRIRAAEKFYAKVFSRNGISEIYESMYVEVRLWCREMHSFQSTPYRIVHTNIWCPICIRKERRIEVTPKEFYDKIDDAGGKCLSPFVNLRVGYCRV